MKIIVGSLVTVTYPNQACHSGRVTEVVGDSIFVAFKNMEEDDDVQFILQDDTWFDASESPLHPVVLVLDVI